MSGPTTDEFLIAVARRAFDLRERALPTAGEYQRKIWDCDSRLFIEAAAKEWPFDCLSWRDISTINEAFITDGHDRGRIANGVLAARKRLGI